MREIAFKAKEIDTGDWVYGYLVRIHEDDYRIVTEDDLNYAYTGGYEYDGTMTKIDKNTICQYTGLTDKSGNKIWENDVVKKTDTNALGYHRERICTVSFDRFGYWKVMTTFGDGYWIGEFEEEQIEVIGNIFDNPELLKGGRNSEN